MKKAGPFLNLPLYLQFESRRLNLLSHLLQRYPRLSLPNSKFLIITNPQAFNQIFRNDNGATLADPYRLCLLSFTGTTTTLDTLFHP